MNLRDCAIIGISLFSDLSASAMYSTDVFHLWKVDRTLIISKTNKGILWIFAQFAAAYTAPKDG